MTINIIIIIITIISIYTDGGAVSRYQDGLREVKEGVKHCLVAFTNHVVKFPKKKYRGLITDTNHQKRI